MEARWAQRVTAANGNALLLVRVGLLLLLHLPLLLVLLRLPLLLLAPLGADLLAAAMMIPSYCCLAAAMMIASCCCCSAMMVASFCPLAARFAMRQAWSTSPFA